MSSWRHLAAVLSAAALACAASPASAETTCHPGKPFDLSFCSPQCPCDQGEGDCDSDKDCKPGLSCVHDVGGSYGAPSYVDVCQAAGPGFGPLPGSSPPPGGLAFGSACTDSRDCQEQLCVSGDSRLFCSRTCTGDPNCPPGYGCQDGVCQRQGDVDPDGMGPSTGPSLKGAGFGTTCSAHRDCASGVCTIEDGQAFCTRLCSLEADLCPLGSVCTATATAAVCSQSYASGELDVVGGCSVGQGSSPAPGEAPWTLSGLLLALLLLRGLVRRRRFCACMLHKTSQRS